MPPKKTGTRAIRPSATDRIAERLRKICLALPEANERLSHGEPTWFAGKGKTFAMLDNHHHGSPHLSVWLPQPPYVGPRGWVGVVLDTQPDWDMVERLVRDAYRHVATKRLVARLG